MAKKKDNGNAGNALAKKRERFESLFNLDSFKEKLQEVMPKHLTKDKLVRLVLVAMSRQPKLFDCEEGSILSAVMKAGECGLDCVGTLGEGYLVPYWSSKNRCLECQFIPGYQGLIKLTRQSGEVQKVEARLIRKGDIFKVIYGTNAQIIHEPTFPHDGDILGAYAVAKLGDTTQFDVMGIDEINAIMDRSNSRNKKGELVGPWVSDFGEMARKTPVRRLQKYLPKSKELSVALEADNKQYDESFAATAEVIGQGLAGLKDTLANAGTKKVDSKVKDTPKSEGKVDPKRQKKADKMAADLQASEAGNLSVDEAAQRLDEAGQNQEPPEPEELPKYQCNSCKQGFESLNKDGRCPLCFSDKFYEM